MPVSQQPASLPWIEQLIRVDTISRNSNLGLIEMVRDHLQQLGLKPWLTYDGSGAKANLFVSVPAADGSTTGGMVLSGHTDVVPVEGQDWDTDPFTPTIRDHKLYGRGSADMKGFLGVVLTQLPSMLAARLSAPLHLAFSFDEEVGCLGAPLMLQQLAARGIKPQGCIVGEPTSMQTVVAHKGISNYRCRVQGRAAHSSLPALGSNAIEYAAQLIFFIRNTADQLRQNGPFDAAFDTVYSTIQTSVIKGGIAINTVPELCEFDISFRNLPEVDAAQLFSLVKDYAHGALLSKMRTEVPNAAIAFEALADVPPLRVDEAARVTQLVRELTQDQATRKLSGATEAGLFQRSGVPAVICGPGDIRQAHRANEYVELAQITRCEQFVQALVDTMVVK
jgi:acetylornithine deacetylase